MVQHLKFIDQSIVWVNVNVNVWDHYLEKWLLNSLQTLCTQLRWTLGHDLILAMLTIFLEAKILRVLKLVVSDHNPGNLPLNAFHTWCIHLLDKPSEKMFLTCYLRNIYCLFYLTNYNWMYVKCYWMYFCSISSKWYSLMVFHWNVQLVHINQFAELGNWELHSRKCIRKGP